MRFIIVIFALLIERFVHIDSYLIRFNWFSAYMEFMHRVFKKTELLKGALGVLLVILPILIIVSIIYYLLFSWFWGFIGFIVSLFILIYSLGPRDLYTLFEGYFVAIVRNDNEEKQKAIETLLCIIPNEENEIPRALTQSVFNHFNYCLFTPIFWFLLLGPIAALLYRLITEVQKLAHVKHSPYHSMLASATWLIKVIEWVPNRIAALGFVLMGDFHYGFSYWIRHSFCIPNRNLGPGLSNQSGLI